MGPTHTDKSAPAATRLERLAAYRALQESFELQRRQTIARSRLIRLRRDTLWGWLPL